MNDQADILKQVESLTGQLTAAQSTLTLRDAAVATLTSERDRALTDLASVRADFDAFKVKSADDIKAAVADAIKANEATLESRIAERVAKLGIADPGKKVDPAVTAHKSYTAEVLELKKAKSVQELVGRPV